MEQQASSEVSPVPRAVWHDLPFSVPSMGRAQDLYRSLGFREIQPYRFNPIPGTAFLELRLG